MDITDSPIQLQNLYNRKSNTYAERKIFAYVTTADLRLDLLEKVRNLAKSKKPDHPWLELSDEDLLKSAGLWEKDFSSGMEGYNLAAVLLLGKDEVINSCCPGYVTDALYRVENMDRYDDRLLATTNLIEAYDLLMEFVAKHTSDKFHLINNVNTSVRDLIAREVIGNILVHRDYSSAYPAKEAAKEASDQKKLSDREQAIYNLICENKHLTVEQVMAEFDISRATVFRDYAKIKKITGAVYDKNESVWKL